MKKVTVDGVSLNVNSGRVVINAEQARRRRGFVKPIKVDEKGNGIYEITSPIQFKHGEEFGFEGEVGKGGTLSDPAAERRAAAEQAKVDEAKIRAAVEAEYQARFDRALEDAKVNLEETNEVRLQAMAVDLETRLRDELTPKIKAELEAAAAAGSKKT